MDDDLFQDVLEGLGDLAIANLVNIFAPINRNHRNPTVNIRSNVVKATTTCANVGNTDFTVPVELVRLDIPPNSVLMPKGSTYTEDQFYHEVVVPPVPPIPKEELERMMKFSTIHREMLRKDHQHTLTDTETLNVIQSATFEVAYKTDQNMLVCAPTGAGKTIIALLCVLRELSHYPNLDALKRSPYKIVYIAPMKALASEIVINFKKRLEPLGLNVREFTGDMHLYAGEVEETDVLVTTPEKYDAVTRRDTSEASLFQTVHLLIVDEVHMLNSDRGPVLEAIIARMFRLRQIQDSRLRIVGLSATLPNYKEIAEFLHVDPMVGLFYFGWGFRPIPLKQTFVGTRNSRLKKHFNIADEVCYAKTLDFAKNGKQVLIFVHSRAGTITTAQYIAKKAIEEYDQDHFRPPQDDNYRTGCDLILKSKLKLLHKLCSVGIGFHHAGMLRDDRMLVEELFRGGHIRVLVSTATLAWGVNLPAYAVIIKGTRLYSASKGSQVNIDLLDMQQMFGRAGRPQYDEMGEAVVITHQLELHLYLSLFQWTMPIQSHLQDSVVDLLNAEIALSSVRSIEEGVDWLSHTFMYIRMKVDRKFYEVTSSVDRRCTDLIRGAVAKLVNAKMVVYDYSTGKVSPTDIGRVASHSYICHETIKVIGEFLDSAKEKTMIEIIGTLAKAKEFQNVKIRPDEAREMGTLRDLHCPHKPNSGLPDCERKVTILLQCWVNRVEIESSSIHLDQIYASQNAGRILRAMFDIAMVKRNAIVSGLVLDLRKSIARKMLMTDHPIYQMKSLDGRYSDLIHESDITLFQLKALNIRQLTKLVRDEKVAKKIMNWLRSLPLVDTEVVYHRPTPNIIQLELKVYPNFVWRKSVNHEEIEPFIAWVENPRTGLLYPPTNFSINCRQAEQRKDIIVKMNIVLNDEEMQKPPTLQLRVVSEYWMGVDMTHLLRQENLVAPAGAKSVFNIIEQEDVKHFPEADIKEENDDCESDWES